MGSPSSNAKWLAGKGAGYHAKYYRKNIVKWRGLYARLKSINPDKLRKRTQAATKRWMNKNPGKASEYAARDLRAHGEKRRAAGRKYAKSNLAKFAAKNARRRAAQIKATPKWAELGEIEKMYELARKQRSHVDHVVPLKSKRVCGLHCLANLQVLSGRENSAKGNRYWPGMWPIVRANARRVDMPRL